MRTQAIIETAVYVDGLQAAETFYGTVLGLPVIGKEPGRHVFFQVGEASVLLAFLAEVTLKGDPLPPHGATGPGHFALGIEAEAFDAWRNLLHGHGVSIEKPWLARTLEALTKSIRSKGNAVRSASSSRRLGLADNLPRVPFQRIP